MRLFETSPLLVARGIVGCLALLSLSGLSLAGADKRSALEEAYAANQWKAAKEIARSLTKGSEAAEGWKYLTLIALRENDTKAAIGFADNATKAAPDRAALFILRANAYVARVSEVSFLSKMKIAKRIRQSYESALQLEPGNVEAIIGLYEYYRQAPAIAGGGRDKASAMLEQLRAVKTATANLHLGLIAIQDKQYAEAHAALARGLETEPANPALLYHSGRLAGICGEYLDAGKQSLEAYLAKPVAPESDLPNHAAALWRLGQIHVHQGNPDDGRQCFERSLLLDPEMEPLVRPDLDRL